MDRDNVRERLFKAISELQSQKIEIMQLLGKSAMRIVKFNKEHKESTFDLKVLNKKLLKNRLVCMIITIQVHFIYANSFI